jgi:cysteinyl-tRNA synthetase
MSTSTAVWFTLARRRVAKRSTAVAIKKLVTNITDVRDRIAVRSSRRLVSTRWIQKCHRCVTRLALAGVLIHRRASHGPVIRQTERDKASRDEQWW